MKKFISAMILSLVFCSFFTVANGENSVVSGPYKITVNDGYAQIIYCDVSNPEISGDYKVPSEVAGYKVRQIGDRAFEGASNITSLTIPEGIESIGEYAFKRCSYFKTLYLPDTLKNIGKGAFENNLSLISVRFPEGINQIPDNLFKDCGFYEIDIPETVVSIGASALENNRNLSEIVLPQGVETIGDRAFYMCGALIDLSSLPQMQKIGSEAFSYNYIQKIVIPSSVSFIAPHAFDGCFDLKEIVFEKGDAPLYLSEPVFCNNFGLERVVFTERVKEINRNEFWLYKGYRKSSLDPQIYYTYENFRESYLEMKEKMVIVCPPFSKAEELATEQGYNFGHDVTVSLNGIELEFDQPPLLRSDRTLVPYRKIMEEMGLEVLWYDETKTVTAKKNEVEISLTIGSQIMHKNGEEINLDVAPVIVNSRTLVPLRAVSEAFECDVGWDGEERRVSVWQ